jgi:hypothetical protein
MNLLVEFGMRYPSDQGREGSLFVPCRTVLHVGIYKSRAGMIQPHYTMDDLVEFSFTRYPLWKGYGVLLLRDRSNADGLMLWY